MIVEEAVQPRTEVSLGSSGFFAAAASVKP